MLQVFKKLIETIGDEIDLQSYCKYLGYAFYCQNIDYAKEILDSVRNQLSPKITDINNSKILDYFNHWTYLTTLDLLEQRFQSQKRDKFECVIRKAKASQEKDNVCSRSL